MNDFYIYGAGINAESIVRFFNNKHIYGIIDRNEGIVGKKVGDIPIISITDYYKHKDGKDILISPYYSRNEIKSDLEKKGIKNVYCSPWMQTKLFQSPRETIAQTRMDEKGEVCFFRKDPISQFLQDTLTALRKCQTFYSEDLTENEKRCFCGNIVVSVFEPDEVLKAISELFPRAKVISLSDEKYRLCDRKTELEIFKDIHKGKRCFLIGNGPSITFDDLNRLRESHEICFGVNRVYLGFDDTEWRPDYYVIVDEKVMREGLKKTKELSIPQFARKIPTFEEEDTSIYWFNSLLQSTEEVRFSDDIAEGIYNGHTVIFEAMQIAAYMGFSEICLLGVDMSQGINYQDEGAHFYRTPNPFENLGQGDQCRAIACLSEGAKHLAEKGCLVENATRDVWWENLPKINLDDVLTKRGSE